MLRHLSLLMFCNLIKSGNFLFFTSFSPTINRFFQFSKLSMQSNRKLSVLSRDFESSYAKKYDRIIGVDEAGRGPLAGPVVVAACYIPSNISSEEFPFIHDSKMLKEVEREEAFKILTEHPFVKYAISIVSHQEIDELNILQASLTGMKRSTEELLTKLSSTHETSKKTKKAATSSSSSTTTIALVDGNHRPKEMSIDCEAIVKGDSRVFSIAAASIIAKVTRDRIMVDYDTTYPEYGFAIHKGYPTAKHRMILAEIGPCPIHRISYGPVQRALQLHSAPIQQSPSAEDEEIENQRSKQKQKKKNKVSSSVEAAAAVESQLPTVSKRKSERKRNSREDEQDQTTNVNITITSDQHKNKRSKVIKSVEIADVETKDKLKKKAKKEINETVGNETLLKDVRRSQRIKQLREQS
jgi:ribonuclease HII